MKRVASLYLPNLSIDRLRRTERAPSPSAFPLHDDSEAPVRQEREMRGPQLGARIEDCSCPRGGGWRPGASWARRDERQAQIDALPAHQRPPMRMLGRRTEAAETPFPARRHESASPVSTERPPSGHGPLVITQRTGQKMVLAAVSPEAAAIGLHPGMPLTQARALVPGLDIRPADPEADRWILTRLALLAAKRWTPCASVCEPDGLWLDLSEVSHLFGGERQMCERILRICSRAGFDARIGVAGATGAAHALARFGKRHINFCHNGREAEAIAHLPPAALRLEDKAIQAARRFGIETIGELIAMPRGPLARRFGGHLLTRLDQALGRTREPFDPIVSTQPPQATLRFLEPILSPEAIEQVVADLVPMLSGQLEQQALGARKISLICDRVDREEQRVTIGTVGATRDGKHLLQLLRMKIETIEPGFGIEAMHLIAGRCEPLSAQQIGSDDQDGALPPVIDRIASRIGPDRVFRCTAVESDVPERSICRTAPLGETRGWPPELPRPVRLLPHPEPIDKVIAELPDQPPVRFSWRGQMHRVRKADGPERIHGEWWKRMGECDAVRDYFQVEDESGARFWLFRKGDGVDGRTGDLSWYIHGLFG